jgi:hypothetical protein
MNLQDVSLSPPAVCTCRVCLFPPPMPEFIDPGFVKTIPKRLFSIVEKELSLSTPSSMCLFPPPMPELIDPVFAKTSPKRSFSIFEK